MKKPITRSCSQAWQTMRPFFHHMPPKMSRTFRQSKWPKCRLFGGHYLFLCLLSDHFWPCKWSKESTGQLNHHTILGRSPGILNSPENCYLQVCLSHSSSKSIASLAQHILLFWPISSQSAHYADSSDTPPASGGLCVRTIRFPPQHSFWPATGRDWSEVCTFIWSDSLSLFDAGYFCKVG